MFLISALGFGCYFSSRRRQCPRKYMSYNANDAVSCRSGIQNWGSFCFFAFSFCIISLHMAAWYNRISFAPKGTKEEQHVAYKTYALNWSMQHLFGAHIVKFRFKKWRKYRGWQPSGPAGVTGLLGP